MTFKGTIAEKIGPIRETTYGRLWDVIVVPQAENIAYTSLHLSFHEDILYTFLYSFLSLPQSSFTDDDINL